MKPAARYVEWPEGPIHGCKVEVLTRDEYDGTCRVKLLEPANVPSWKAGDIATILISQLKVRRP